ncbi:MAG: UDP-N-acetylmuramoyl-L-alanyl-D-glutamate--2,6-diaminopimelate ligase, partial [Clostridia bacterium]|nr:UDP-N-acetylmuramoyl-L-alanyl-D-glutamate--2,6-diaminopimelate ligase [Clostridia bacterium]
MATIAELTKKVGITQTNLDSFDMECGRLRTNSLECTYGDTFICIKGGKVDGHDFICTAVDHGARLIVCERVTVYLKDHPEIPYIAVENTRLAAAHMWNEYCGRPSDRLILVAVTGTNGKTSTTYFLREIFKAAGYVTGVIGTVRCLIGDKTEIISDSADSNVNSMTTPTPEQLYPMLEKMADEGVEIVFMEASSHSLAQYRLDPLRFTVGIFTGLTQDHLDYHGTMEEYYLSKRSLFAMCGAAVINADDPIAERLAREIDVPSVKYSVSGRLADYMAKDIDCERPDGIAYTFSDKNDFCRINCPVSGLFMVSNTLGAISTARLFAIKQDVIVSALSKCPQIPGRMEHIPLPKECDFDVFIDYAHTPDALENVLKTLLALKRPDGRIVVVFGCGGDRDRTKRPIMGRIATTLAGLTVITGDNSRSENPRAIICDILRAVADGADCKVIERREKAIRWVIENHRAGDIILLAGKGHEDYEIDADGKHPFSESAIVLETVQWL